MWRWLLGLAIVAGAAIGVLLGALNPDPVTLNLVFFKPTAALGALVVLSACAGLIIGFVSAAAVMMFRRRSRREKPARPSEASTSLTDV